MFKAQLSFIYLLSTLQTTDKTVLTGPTGTVQLYSPTQGVYTPGAVFTCRVRLHQSDVSKPSGKLTVQTKHVAYANTVYEKLGNELPIL